MKRGTFAAAAAAISATCARGSGSASAFVPQPSPRERLATRGESTAYAESSTLADVNRILAELDRRGAPIVRGMLGTTSDGRDIPFVVAARPIVRTPAEAHALGRPIVYVQAARDGSAVEGTEALLAIVRDLCLSAGKTLLDEVVLVVVPVLNVDGAERRSDVRGDAPDRNGPASVGSRANARGVDLDCDFVVASAPETRALLRFLDAWKPDVFVDLSSDGGSFHTFGATYAPSLHPAGSRAYVRDMLIPAVRKEMADAFGIATFSFGQFGRTRALFEPPVPSDPDYGWFPRDYRIRSAVNYIGLRDTLAILVSAYARDPFARRIFTTRASVEAVLGFCSDRAAELRASTVTAPPGALGIPVRGVLAADPAAYATIAWENLALDDSGRPQPGVPPGFRRTGTFESAELPLFDRYTGSAYRAAPAAYVIPGAVANHVMPLLDVHGIDYGVLTTAVPIAAQSFTVEAVRTNSNVNARTLFDLAGRWATATVPTRPGDLFIPVAERRGALLSILLEPESDDGFLAWNIFGEITAGATAPVFRAMGAT